MVSSESDALRVLYSSMAERMAANPDMDLVSLRSLFEDLSELAKEPEGVTYSEVDLGSVGGLYCLPVGVPETHVVLYFHGGGFVGNSIHSHRKLTGHLAKKTGAMVFSVDYRRAPEALYPAQLEDAVAAYDHFLQRGIAADRIAVAGDSAGGGLAVALTLKLRESGKPLPGATAVFSPWVDMEHGGKTLESNAQTDALVSRAVVESMSSMFLGPDGDPTDPFVNPLRADLTGLPPLFVAAGEYETLLDDSERLAELASVSDVEVKLLTYPEQQHVFVYMAGRAPEADEALTEAAAWLRRHLELL